MEGSLDMLRRVVALAAPAVGILGFLVTTSGCASSPATHAHRGEEADLILYGGKIFTADHANTWAEAISIHGERILSVGSNEAVLASAGPSTSLINLGGRVAIPGINDTHTHLTWPRPVGPAVSADPDWVQGPAPHPLLDSLAALARRTPPGTWLRGEMGMRIRSDPGLRRAALDRVAPDHPVILVASYGNGSMVNTRALRMLGIAETAPDPTGGWYEREPGSRIVTGLLDGSAQYAAWDAYYSSAPEALVKNLRAVAGEAAMVGVTTLQNMSSVLSPGTAERAFAEANLPVRVRVIQMPSPGTHADWHSLTNRRLAPLTYVSGVKYIVEGTPIEQFALMRRPYEGRPDWHGQLYYTADTMRTYLQEALRKGDQPMLHVVGDSAAVLMLRLMEDLAPDSVWRARRPRFEHGGAVSADLVPTALRLGVIISQPRTNADQIRMWHRAGLTVAYGSDADPGNPFETLRDWTTPVDAAGAFSREDAIRMFTRNSAYAEFTEREKGTLAPGMLADLAVLSQDIFTVPAEALADTRSVLTLVGGKVVYDAGAIAAEVRKPE
jgi:predicted amidohydrolase YtcJ